MNLTETLFRFLQYTTELPVLCWDGTAESLHDFEKRHCFLPQVQPMMTADSLSLILGNLHAACLYSSQDLLGICTLTFDFEGSAFLAGPYVHEEWQDDRAERILAGLGLPASYLLPYKMYYCSYRLLDDQSLVRLATGAITALKPGHPPYLHQTLSGLQGTGTPELFGQKPLDFDLAVRRYEQENKFLHLIEEGKTNAALEVYARIGKMGMDRNFNAENPRTMIANATIMRTLVRKAAERGGLHPAIVDAISAPYAQKMYAAVNAQEIYTMILDMIREFGEAIRLAKQEHYSPIVNKAASYISLHLSQEMTQSDLAGLVHVSPAHLSRQFKAETGMTISQYIMKKRCRKAAELLRESCLTVQDISVHVGYLDSNYFVKVFKNVYHMTPTGYRSQFGRRI